MSKNCEDGHEIIAMLINRAANADGEDAVVAKDNTTILALGE